VSAPASSSLGSRVCAPLLGAHSWPKAGREEGSSMLHLPATRAELLCEFTPDGESVNSNTKTSEITSDGKAWGVAQCRELAEHTQASPQHWK
jgi:hypothetical protein